METALRIAAVAIIGYLLGSLNFAIIISKRLPKGDIRNIGSGNAGATNMLRNNGKVAAAFTALGDIAKCVAAVLLGGLIFTPYGGMIAGFTCLLGHCYPLYFGFRGGKGVITAAIMGLCITPFSVLIALAVFIVLVALTKYVSLGSCVGIVVFAVMNAVFAPDNIFGIIWGATIAVFVLARHSSNIVRLCKGTESKMNY